MGQPQVLERIGNCRIVQEIGSGGMAVIYKAVQESLNRTVAIKALKPAVAADSNFAVRFEREALSISSLQHENIVHVYDFHKHEGSLYIVMEFVEGIDLYDLLDKAAPLPPDIAAIIAMQVARALDHAHYRGIIHRDIKPANIMIGKNGSVKLMDFGIARDQAFGDLTQTGTGLGTPSYMSPEQILGDKLDYRSDMFSLGIVLFQMAVGKKPFIEDDEKSVMHKIRLEKLPSARKENPLVPRELERIIARCLEKKKEHRFRTTQDLVLALERFISKRTLMNYNARLVLYLRDQKIITDKEADAQLHPAIVGGYGQPTLPDSIAWAQLKQLIVRQAWLLGGTALALAFLHASQIGAAPAPPPGVQVVQPTQPPGFVKIIVDPWADVFVDGYKIDTTPFAKALSLPEGEHRIEFRNPAFEIERRKIVIKRDVTSTVKVKLVRK